VPQHQSLFLPACAAAALPVGCTGGGVMEAGGGREVQAQQPDTGRHSSAMFQQISSNNNNLL